MDRYQCKLQNSFSDPWPQILTKPLHASTNTRIIAHMCQPSFSRLFQRRKDGGNLIIPTSLDSTVVYAPSPATSLGILRTHSITQPLGILMAIVCTERRDGILFVLEGRGCLLVLVHFY